MNAPIQQKNLRFLLSRTDNIGDVIFTLPMAYLLKQRFPDCKIFFLARDYVRAVVEACPAIDEFLSWDALQRLSEKKAASSLGSYEVDIAIHVFPRHQVARLIFRANIPYRIGTSHRWYHYLYCNQLIKFSRKNASQHEAQLNLKLLAPFAIKDNYSVKQLKALIALSPKPIPLPQQVEDLLDAKRFNLIIHSLSNNNGREWSLENYQNLISLLPIETFNVFITGAPAEVEQLKPLTDKCPNAHDVSGQLNLNEFTEFMRRCDGLLASGTGPLHMASALGIKTLGLYPPAQTINPTRWAPLGKQAEYLVADSACVEKCLNPEERTCACMKMLSVKQVKEVLLSWKK